MLEHHKKKNADATIAVLDVPMEEASRFGIMITNDEGDIVDFEEKPKHPRSTLGRRPLEDYAEDLRRRSR